MPAHLCEGQCWSFQKGFSRHSMRPSPRVGMKSPHTLQPVKVWCGWHVWCSEHVGCIDHVTWSADTQKTTRLLIQACHKLGKLRLKQQPYLQDAWYHRW
jgi:hypothetical protein